MSLSSEIYNLFDQHWKAKTYKGNQFLLHVGGTVNSAYFVKKGLLRVGVNPSGGRSYNKTFVDTGMFYANFYDYWQQRPSHYEIQALEDSEVLVMPISVIDKELSSGSTEALKIQVEYMKQRYLRHEQREISLQTLSAKGRYLEFLELHADSNIERRIPAYHLASYLGMTDISLSRLKKEIASSE